LDRPERARTIRQDSSQNVVDTPGDDGQEPCDGPAAPNSRPRSEAERTPDPGSPQRTALLAPQRRTRFLSDPVGRATQGWNAAILGGNGGPPPATHHDT
ncbi:hypothetical protein J2Y41_004697, partial [Arthrobacter sp. 1088]|uniref:hypothetical protein n=1 Tax=Arthrobacter sp. 1088 TaxID=2817768 RepID=UPI0028550DBC